MVALDTPFTDSQAQLWATSEPNDEATPLFLDA
jgi:hypothetical protein